VDNYRKRDLTAKKRLQKLITSMAEDYKSFRSIVDVRFTRQQKEVHPFIRHAKHGSKPAMPHLGITMSLVMLSIGLLINTVK